MLEEKRIRVLMINWSIEDGSIAKLIADIEKVNSEKCEFFHCYQVGKKGDDQKYRVAGWNVTRFYYMWARITGIKYGVGTLPTFFLLRWIRKIRPDVVHIHCPNFYNINLYMLLEYLKKEHYRVIITNHAEFFYTGNCAYAEECLGYLYGCTECKRIFDTKHPYLRNRTNEEWKRMRAIFSDFSNLKMVAVSEWVKERCQNSPITKGIPVTVIENAVDESIFRKKIIDVSKWNKKNVTGGKVILNVTSGFSDRIDDLKGGIYLIQLAREMPQYDFWVAGNIYLDYYDKIPENLLLLGSISDRNELAELYNYADLTVLTSRRETYGMACAESLACGTPVVAFLAGGTESIALKEYTEFALSGDVESLKRLVFKWINKKEKISNSIAQKAKKRYSVKRMGEEYLQLYLK